MKNRSWKVVLMKISRAAYCIIAGVTFCGISLAETPPSHVNYVDGRLITFNSDGGWCWYQDERTIVNNGQILIGSVASPSGDVNLTVYGVGSRQCTVVTLHKGLQSDDHDTPALTVLPDGRYLAVYSKHGNDRIMRWRISEHPGEAMVWNEEQTVDVGARVTYSNVFRVQAESDRLYNFHRGLGWDPNFMISDDGGSTWRYGGHLLANASDPNSRMRPYLKYASGHGGTIHFLTTEAHPQQFEGTSIYHGYFKQGKIFNSDGTLAANMVEGPGEPTALTKVYAGDIENEAWTSDLHVDSEGNPFIAYSVHKSNNDHRYRFARWNGKRWYDHEIAYGGSRLYPGEDHYTGNMALDPNDSNTVYISSDSDPVTGGPLVSEGDGKRHYEIFCGSTRDSGETWIWNAVTRNSTMDNIRPVVPIWDSTNTALLWLRGSYLRYTDYRLAVVGLIDRADKAGPQTNE